MYEATKAVYADDYGPEDERDYSLGGQPGSEVTVGHAPIVGRNVVRNNAPIQSGISLKLEQDMTQLHDMFPEIEWSLLQTIYLESAKKNMDEAINQLLTLAETTATAQSAGANASASTDEVAEDESAPKRINSSSGAVEGSID